MPKEAPMQTGRRRWRRLLARVLVVAWAGAPAVAGAQGADALALTIEQNLDGIEFRMDLRPTQAAADLEAQGRQLELLEQEAPDHPALPELKLKFEDLQAEAAVATAGASGDADAAGLVATAPEGFTSGIEQVANLQQQAEAELLRGNAEGATGYLEEAEAQMSALERDYQGDIPQGHVPLLVAKEKLAALKDQLAAAKSE
jgi:hypothetical protein